MLHHRKSSLLFCNKNAQNNPIPVFHWSQMLHHLHKAHPLLIKTLSTSTFPPQKSHLDWRTQAKQAQLLSQISTILLQTHTKNWAPLFYTLDLPSPKELTPSFFHQILHKIQSHPQISLNFFNWAKKNLDFKPDLKALSKLAQILFGSGFSSAAKPILDSLIQAYPPKQIVLSLIQSCEGTSFDNISHMLSSVVECYCSKSMNLEALEVYFTATECGMLLSVYSCNALLNLLLDKNEVNLTWCLYGSMIRNGVVENQFTWSLITRILYAEGKFERIVRILDMGIYSSGVYNLVIEYCSKRGDFEAAFSYLDEMCSKKLDPSFSTYSSILDGACQYDDLEVVGKVMVCMTEKGFMPADLRSEYDLLLQKLTDLGKTCAAMLFYKKASEEKVELQDASYGCMLRALSKKGRVRDAIVIYRLISSKNIVVNYSCYNAFLDSLCTRSPSEEVNESLKDVIRRGFRPPVTEVSEYVNSLCVKRQWKQAEELLNIILEKGFLPDSSCYYSLVKRYCSIRRIDFAAELHGKIEKWDSNFDIQTYNLYLSELFRCRRTEAALRVFDYMRSHNILSSESFSIAIRELCHEKDMRQAMKLHDEMLELGLKPDRKTYKRLISGFK